MCAVSCVGAGRKDCGHGVYAGKQLRLCVVADSTKGSCGPESFPLDAQVHACVPPLRPCGAHSTFQRQENVPASRVASRQNGIVHTARRACSNAETQRVGIGIAIDIQ